MTKKTAVRTIDGIQVEMGSGNVFADLGLPDADKLKIKSGLVIEITKAMRKLGLTQKAAAERMGRGNGGGNLTNRSHQEERT